MKRLIPLISVTLALIEAPSFAVTDQVNITAPAAVLAPAPRCRLIPPPDTQLRIGGVYNIRIQPYTVPASNPPPDWIRNSTLKLQVNSGPVNNVATYQGMAGGVFAFVRPGDPPGTVYRFSGEVVGVSVGPVACDNTVTLTDAPPLCQITATPGFAKAMCNMLVPPQVRLSLLPGSGPANPVGTIDGWPVALNTNVTLPFSPVDGFGRHNYVGGVTGNGPGYCNLLVPSQCDLGEQLHLWGCIVNGAGPNPSTVVWTGTYGEGSPPSCGPGTSRVDLHETPYGNYPSCEIQAHFNFYDGRPPVVANRGCTLGCFAPETKMLMGDRSLKPADKVRIGDWLWNPVRKKPVMVKMVIAGPETIPLVEVGYNGTLIRVSSKHPMVTPGGVRRADTLTTNDSVLGLDGKYHPVTVARWLPFVEGQMVYNFELYVDSSDPDDHMIVGDGVVTGDYFLQYKLEKGLLH